METMLRRTEEAIDLEAGAYDQVPMRRFVNLVLRQAIQDSAERIEFWLIESSPKNQFRISYSGQGKTHDLAPPPSELFEPVINVLCNYASVNYYAKGAVKSRFKTKLPDSSWNFESDDLKRAVVLVKDRT